MDEGLRALIFSTLPRLKVPESERGSTGPCARGAADEERHNVAIVGVFPRNSTESGGALGADVLGKKGKIGWMVGKGMAVKKILKRRVGCVGANSATYVVAGGDFGAADL